MTKRRCISSLFVLVLLAGAAWCPADEDPPNPFGKPRTERQDARPATVTFSDGKVLEGDFYLTHGKPFHVFDTKRNAFRDVPADAVTRIDVEVERERMEKEWRFLEHANDEKVFTGKTYPMRKYVTTLEIVTGAKIRGNLSTLMYVKDAQGKVHRLFINKRDKGEPGQTLKDLVYIKSIVLHEKKDTDDQRKPDRIEPKKDPLEIPMD
ncbi:MAG: hypothetical protein ACOCXX_03940 [Planctomycetota bacterium]